MNRLSFLLWAGLGLGFAYALGASQQRTLHFPPDGPVGEVLIQDENQVRSHQTFSYVPLDENWDFLAVAKADVSVPAGKRVLLRVSQNGAKNTAWLAQLAPDDLYALTFWGELVNDRSISGVARFTGLKVLSLVLTQVGDNGLQQLTDLKALEFLSLPMRTTDTGLATVAAHLRGLKALFFTNTRVHNAALRHLATLRGLEALYLGGQFITDDGLAFLASLPNLEYLTIWGPTFTGRGFVHLRQVPSLRIFNSLRIPTIRDAGLEHLAALPHLESVSLYDNPLISDAGMSLLAQSRALRRLDINQTQVTEKGVAALMKIQSWEYLSLPQGSANDNTLGLLSRQAHLRHLHLSPPRPRNSYTAKGLAELARLEKLEELQLAGPGVTDTAMVQVAKHRNLNSLSLLACPISNAGLASLSPLQSLQRLALIGTKEITLGGLSRLNALPRLTHLHASQIRDDDRPLELGQVKELHTLMIHLRSGLLRDDSLACLGNLYHLNSVQLPSTAITDRGLAYLAGLTNLSNLLIDGSMVSDRGLAYLARLQNLGHLSLTGNISEAGLPSFQKLPRLSQLNLHSSQKISPAALQRLKGAMPNLAQATAENSARVTRMR